MRSLTRRLIVGVLLAELLCAAGFAVVAIVHEMHVRRRAFDIMLRGRADSLLGAVQDADDPEANVTVDRSELVLPSEDIYEVLSPTGRLLGESENGDARALRGPGASQRLSQSEGYFDIKVGRVHYRVLRKEGVRVIDRLENGGTRRPVTLIYGAPTRHLFREVVEAARFYVLTSVLLLAVTGAVLAWLLGRWLSPLRELALSASRVSVASWEFAPTENALPTRELNPIILSMRQLLTGLREAFERQRRFTGDAAHELKTSLTLLKSSLQLLTMGQRNAEEYEAGLRDLTIDIQRMEELTERMLALARIEEEGEKPAEVVDLGITVRSVAQRLKPLAEANQVKIGVIGDGACLVSVQASDAEILSSNLLMNAVQHSPAGAEVTVSLTAQNGTAEMQVSDQGDGIPESAQAHIFERFYRTDASRSRQSGGTGLGLAICKAIVERSRGTIAVESGAGRGTLIIVRLPTAG
jgi:signal transduction histidine kinase